MYPVLFEIGSFSFRSYGLMIAIGTLVGYWVAYRNRSKIGLKDDDMLDLLLLLIVFGIIGAKVTYILTNNPLYYFSNPKEIISGSGLSFIGIVIFGLATCWFYALKKKINFFGLIDVLAPGLMIGYAIGRIGCFLNGCCYGLPTTSWIGFQFNSFYEPRYPTQLFISFGALVCFFILLYILKKKKFHGAVFGSFCLLYSIITFIVGFYRDMVHYPPFNLTLNQYSIFIIVPVGICILVYGSKKYQMIQMDGKTMEGKVEVWDKRKFDDDNNEVIVQ